MKKITKITRKLIIATVVAITLLSVVYAAEIDDPYQINCIAKPPITTLQGK